VARKLHYTSSKYPQKMSMRESRVGAFSRQATVREHNGTGNTNPNHTNMHKAGEGIWLILLGLG
jgi:hypothetical protein